MKELGAKTWAIIGGSVLAIVVLLVTFIDSSVLSDKEAALLAPKVASQTAPVGSVAPAAGSALEGVRVYVDRTFSMRPYTAPDQSPYFNLLRELDGLLAGDIQFFGFGYPSEERGQVVESVDPVLLEESSQYAFVNNDYGPLFSGLDTSQTHLVVSDGVQSEPKEGERFAKIVRSIGDWIEQDGVFALMAYRAPYRGTYYHEAPTVGQIGYSCDDRPFYAFGFFPSATSKEELIGILENGQVSPEYVLTVGEESASIAARPYGPAEDANVPRGPRVLASFKDHGKGTSSVDRVYSGRPTGQGDSEVPLHFNVRFDSTETLWNRLSAAQMQQVAQSLDPSFQHWRIDALSASEERVALTPLRSLRVHDATSQSGEDRWQANVNTSLTYAPDERTRIVSLLTLGVSPAGANALVPDSYTTRRDDQSSACSRTLNIQRTMGAVLREHYVLGRAMLVTEWMP